MGSGRGKARRTQASTAVKPGPDEPTINERNVKEWHDADGELHRIGGPAIEYASGARGWFVGGKEHRDDGPAIEWANGTKIWYRDGELHRVDGPAVEDANGCKEWWVDGVELTEAEFEERTAELRLEAARRAAREAAEQEIKTNPDYRNPFRTRTKQ